MKFYERMRLLRNEKHLSQSTVAEYLHVGRRTYSDYENGSNPHSGGKPDSVGVSLQCQYELYGWSQ